MTPELVRARVKTAFVVVVLYWISFLTFVFTFFNQDGGALLKYVTIVTFVASLVLHIVNAFTIGRLAGAVGENEGSALLNALFVGILSLGTFFSLRKKAAESSQKANPTDVGE